MLRFPASHWRLRSPAHGWLYAVHVENKPRHGTWREGQAQGYERRARLLKERWGHKDFDTVLIAPLAFIEQHPEEVARFNVAIPYEELCAFVPAFGAPGSRFVWKDGEIEITRPDGTETMQ